MRILSAGLITLLFFLPQFGSGPDVAMIRLQAHPGALLRPNESITIQLLAYTELQEKVEGQEETKTRYARVQAAHGSIFLGEPSESSLSKPFHNSGGEQEPFYEEPELSWARILLGRVTRQLVVQDSVLYTAPPEAGTYKVQATLGLLSTEIEIQVDPKAAPVKLAETTSFDGEQREAEPYRHLAAYYAPFVAQETWFDPKSDYLARFDFDGDWIGDNNWESAPTGSSQAYVYYAGMETETHWFLIYNFFHPRDYSDKCLPEMCHENDNEGLILTVRKNGDRFGRLETMETLAHNNIYSYRASREIGSGIHRIDGDIELVDESHPAVFIESGGHGVYGSDDSHSRYDPGNDRLALGTGVTYVFTGTPERPARPDSRRVGYELLPIRQHWWDRAHHPGGGGRAFDSYYHYEPFGDRPRAPYEQIAGSFLGRTHGRNKAKPFWGWHDKRTRDRRALATGQWALDPAYAVSINLRLPAPVSTDYVYNPFLGIGSPPAPDRWMIVPADGN